ncbi:gamma-glutamyltransferase [Granulicella paludicola]|uniref:gamma-glutamyltransferase n=1 Tax=Granulicella paludicola TaxID=474951 RepID=UPI0021E0079B|nr:gamma-glutamyltransferase [Granulicella paludicola]
MKQLLSAAVGLSVLTTGPLSGYAQSNSTPVTSRHAMVVSIDHDATDAGVEILREGGNAVDAAVAVGFALAVVYPAAGNIGGGGFMLIRPGSGKLAHGKAKFLDYREKAPASASANMYLDAEGKVIPKMSTAGGKASGVPGSVAGLTFAERHYGRLGLAKVMAPAIRLAKDGFVLEEEFAKVMHSNQLTLMPASHRIFQRDGDFYKAGEVFKQPELAATLERIAADPDDFYKGKMADQIAEFEAANNGQITKADLAAYEVKEREPLEGHYRGLQVVTSPPPSSGGIVLLETLNILSGYDLPKLGGDRSVGQIHTITEAFRRSYMDRGDYLGDPDFNKMPLKQMADPRYAAAWRATIDATRPSPSATLVRPAGFMPEPPKVTATGHESPQTTQYSVVDADGNAVSVTTTLNFFFGSGVTVEPLGFLLNDEMDDFTSKIGVPNGFGLIQGPANAIAPGKRPLSSMTPTIVSEPDHHFLWVHKPGKLRLVLGTPGGSTITTTVANVLISVVDNGLNIQQAADAPRFHHQFLPDVLQFDKYFADAATINALKAVGYKTQQQSTFDEKAPGVWGDCENIERDPNTGMLIGGHDFRHTFGKAAGY